LYITSSSIIANNKDSVVLRSFYSGATKTNLKYSWSVDQPTNVKFKDNKQSLDSSVVFFSTPGFYTVTLTFTDSKKSHHNKKYKY